MAPIRDSQIQGDYEEVGNDRPSPWSRWWMGWFDWMNGSGGDELRKLESIL
jgi:hypothetical protein